MPYEIPHRNRHCAPRGENRLREPHPGPRFLLRRTHRATARRSPVPHRRTNPTGILFNPLSIAAALRSYADEAPVQQSELDFDGELWFHYGFHGSLSAASPDEALAAMNAAPQAGADALRTCRPYLLTLGTAWVYERQRARWSPTATAGPPTEFFQTQAFGRGDRRGVRGADRRAARRKADHPHGQPRTAYRRRPGGQRREQGRRCGWLPSS